MVKFIRTYSDTWLQRHRETHERHAQFGTHRHPYLIDIVRELAAKVRQAIGEPPSLLDYGCGKGVFMGEISRLSLFRFISGYDPAINRFKSRPSQLYDIVVCLDVLDQIEDAFVESVISDVAQFTGHVALFDVITIQTPALAHLNPRSATTWREIISRHMKVEGVTVRPATAQELAEGACPERTIIHARPRGSGTPA